MRDIRGDLQDRASFLEEQINAAQAQFEKRMELFTREHDSKIADLQAELEAVTMLMEREYRRIMSAPEVSEERRQAGPQPAPEHQRSIAVEPELYDEPEMEEEEPEALAEEEPQVVREEPPRRPAAAEAERPGRRAPEPQYAPRQAQGPREAEPYRQPAAAEARPRRPMPVEEPVQESRTAAPQVHRRPAQEPERRQQAPAAAQQQPPLADFLIRKLGESGAMNLDDLSHFAIREGYFAEGDNPDRAVHATLMNVVKAGFIRQLPNGTFAPATVMDTIRLRRAI